MALSYHGVVGHTSRSTLPSVSSWSSNMNILRDPPKAIQTRKIDKVGESSEIVQMMQESGDRACEAILQYARGVNPMVSVSYSNYGNNGGTRVNINKPTPSCNGATNSGRQAYLPYRIMDNGAFRFPIYDQRDRLPLSRLPRVWTSSFTKKGFADFSKKTLCPTTAEKTRQVKNDLIKTCVQPRAVYRIETPLVETYEVKNVIQNPINVSTHSGMKTIGKVTTHVAEPTKEIIEDPMSVHAQANRTSANPLNGEMTMNTEKYLQESLHSDVQSKFSQNVQLSSLEELYGVNPSNVTQNKINIDYTVNKIATKQQEYIHSDLELKRPVPEHKAHTNVGQNIHKKVVTPITERTYENNRPNVDVMSSMGRNMGKRDDISSRQYNLKPRVSPGGFEMTPSMPTMERVGELTEFDTEQSKMRRRVFEMQHGRHDISAQNPYL